MFPAPVPEAGAASGSQALNPLRHRNQACPHHWPSHRQRRGLPTTREAPGQASAIPAYGALPANPAHPDQDFRSTVRVMPVPYKGWPTGLADLRSGCAVCGGCVCRLEIHGIPPGSTAGREGRSRGCPAGWERQREVRHEAAPRGGRGPALAGAPARGHGDHGDGRGAVPARPNARRRRRPRPRRPSRPRASHPRRGQG